MITFYIYEEVDKKILYVLFVSFVHAEQIAGSSSVVNLMAYQA